MSCERCGSGRLYRGHQVCWPCYKAEADRCNDWRNAKGNRRGQHFHERVNYPSGPDHPAWKGDDIQTQTGRERAQSLYELGKCERCSAKATDRHHKDGNTRNNERENIELLCRRCHMVVDGRLAVLIAHPKPKKPAGICTHCGYAYKPLRKGLCAGCYMWQKKNGTLRPLPAKEPPAHRRGAA